MKGARAPAYVGDEEGVFGSEHQDINMTHTAGPLVVLFRMTEIDDFSLSVD